MLTIIAAMSRNRVIGKDGGIPWREPEDMKFFKATTMGHPVIMGRKTWGSLGKWQPLPGRTNIMISGFRQMGAGISHHAAQSLQEAIRIATDPGTEGSDEVFVIGGAQVYREALPLADRILLTTINREIEGDTYFPELGAEWERIERRATPIIDKQSVGVDEFAMTFDTYMRIPS